MKDSVMVSGFIEAMQEIFTDHEVMVHGKESCSSGCYHNVYFSRACTLFADLAGPRSKKNWDTSRHVRERFRKKISNAVLYH